METLGHPCFLVRPPPQLLSFLPQTRVEILCDKESFVSPWQTISYAYASQPVQPVLQEVTGRQGEEEAIGVPAPTNTGVRSHCVCVAIVFLEMFFH